MFPNPNPNQINQTKSKKWTAVKKFILLRGNEIDKSRKYNKSKRIKSCDLSIDKNDTICVLVRMMRLIRFEYGWVWYLEWDWFDWWDWRDSIMRLMRLVRLEYLWYWCDLSIVEFDVIYEIDETDAIWVLMRLMRFEFWWE